MVLMSPPIPPDWFRCCYDIISAEPVDTSGVFEKLLSWEESLQLSPVIFSFVDKRAIFFTGNRSCFRTPDS